MVIKPKVIEDTMKNFRLITIFIFAISAVGLMGCMGSNDPATGGASGVVLDTNAKALSGATVTVGGRSTVTDYFGKWSMGDLEAQIYEFTASKENYQSQTKSYEIQSGMIAENITFQLPLDTEIFDIVVSELSSTKATIIFKTKFEATTKIAYGSNSLVDKVQASNSTHKFTHTFELTGLTPSTTYVYQCLGTDKYNRQLSSEVKTFTTPVSARGEPPTGLAISKVYGNTAFTLSWNADATADFAGFNVYRSSGADSVFSKVNIGLVKQASYVDMDVKVGEKYFYRVTRVGGNGDESSPSTKVSMVMPGTITTNVVWNAQGSPYELTGDLTIAQGASLIIAKGTEVLFSNIDQWDSDSSNVDKVGITVLGTLLVQGSEGEPVYMTSREAGPQSGDWEGISFRGSADLSASLIKCLNVQFAETGISGVNGLPEITGCSFSNCSLAGVSAVNSESNININNSSFVSCNTGISVGNSAVTVEIKDNRFMGCSYGIKAVGNSLNQITGNRIKKNIVTAIEVGGTNSASTVSKNTIGWGTGGTGIVCNGMDEIRRNTIQANLCIQVKDTANAIIRSNLLLADKDRNSMGLLYASNETSSVKLSIQNNGVWNQTIPAMKYGNSSGSSVVATGDLAFASTSGPALTGGDPFVTAYTDMDFSYVPKSGSTLKKAGYDSQEDIGAEDVPN